MDVAPVFRHSLLLKQDGKSSPDQDRLSRISRIAPETGSLPFQLSSQRQESLPEQNQDAVVLNFQESPVAEATSYTIAGTLANSEEKEQELDSKEDDSLSEQSVAGKLVAPESDDSTATSAVSDGPQTLEIDNLLSSAPPAARGSLVNVIA